jgi:Zn-finger protein
MDDLTKKTHEKHIEVILADSSFLVRCKNHPELCPCYLTGEPCHSTIPKEELNCHYCLCPMYDSSKDEGGCRVGSPAGKWHPSPKKSTGRVWDCSNCDYPHRIENARAHLRMERGLE